MKLTRKLTLALFLVVLVVISGFAYVRIEREVALFDGDMRRDHRIMIEAWRAWWRRVASGRTSIIASR